MSGKRGEGSEPPSVHNLSPPPDPPPSVVTIAWHGGNVVGVVKTGLAARVDIEENPDQCRMEYRRWVEEEEPNGRSTSARRRNRTGSGDDCRELVLRRLLTVLLQWLVVAHW
jgi:hypothetical protein